MAAKSAVSVHNTVVSVGGAPSPKRSRVNKHAASLDEGACFRSVVQCHERGIEATGDGLQSDYIIPPPPPSSPAGARRATSSLHSGPDRLHLPKSEGRKVRPEIRKGREPSVSMSQPVNKLDAEAGLIGTRMLGALRTANALAMQPLLLSFTQLSTKGQAMCVGVLLATGSGAIAARLAPDCPERALAVQLLRLILIDENPDGDAFLSPGVPSVCARKTDVMLQCSELLPHLASTLSWTLLPLHARVEAASLLRALCEQGSAKCLKAILSSRTDVIGALLTFGNLAHESASARTTSSVCSNTTGSCPSRPRSLARMESAESANRTECGAPAGSGPSPPRVMFSPLFSSPAQAASRAFPYLFAITPDSSPSPSTSSTLSTLHVEQRTVEVRATTKAAASSTPTPTQAALTDAELVWAARSEVARTFHSLALGGHAMTLLRRGVVPALAPWACTAPPPARMHVLQALIVMAAADAVREAADRTPGHELLGMDACALCQLITDLHQGEPDCPRHLTSARQAATRALSRVVTGHKGRPVALSTGQTDGPTSASNGEGTPTSSSPTGHACVGTPRMARRAAVASSCVSPDDADSRLDVKCASLASIDSGPGRHTPRRARMMADDSVASNGGSQAALLPRDSATSSALSEQSVRLLAGPEDNTEAASPDASLEEMASVYGTIMQQPSASAVGASVAAPPIASAPCDQPSGGVYMGVGLAVAAALGFSACWFS
jgi:hypothetical protein